MKIWLKTLFRTWTPWEERLIEVLLAETSPRYRSTISGQLSSVNRISRILGWIEIDLYVMKNGKIDRTGMPLLFDDQEFDLALIETKTKNMRFETRVGCVSGFVFSFESNHRIRDLAYAEGYEMKVLEFDKRFRLKRGSNITDEAIDTTRSARSIDTSL